MPWCKLEDSFRDHRKPKRLARELGVRRAEARGLCAALWSWALIQAEDGDLGDFDVDEIEGAADWEGEPGALVAAMASGSVGMLDVTPAGYALHGYMRRAESYKRATVTRERRAARDQGVTGGMSRHDVQHLRTSSVQAPHVVAKRGEERRGDETRGEEKTETVARKLAESVSSAVIDDIWVWYRRHHPRAAKKMGAKESKLCKARLKNFTPDDIKQAIDGYHRSPYHCGKNETGTKYQSLELILRDDGKVQRGIEFATEDRGPVLTEQSQQTVDAVNNFVRKMTEDDDDQK